MRVANRTFPHPHARVDVRYGYDLVVTPTNQTSKERLEDLIGRLNKFPEGYNKLPQEARIKIAIETCESLFGLTVAINDLANQSVQTLNELTGAITQATQQAGRSSAEAAAVATQSANLSRQLNRLTKWIIAAVVLSAVAAVIQAGVAVFSILNR